MVSVLILPWMLFHCFRNKWLIHICIRDWRRKIRLHIELDLINNKKTHADPDHLDRLFPFSLVNPVISQRQFKTWPLYSGKLGIYATFSASAPPRHQRLRANASTRQWREANSRHIRPTTFFAPTWPNGAWPKKGRLQWCYSECREK